MAVNKVIYGSETLLDLTQDTVTANDMISGVTAHSKTGSQITGTLVIQAFHVGAADPESSLGNDGDIYFKVEE